MLPHDIAAATLYYDLHFTSETTGYFVYRNMIYKTTDQGRTWSRQVELSKTHPAYEASSYLQSIYFLDDQHGFAVGPFERFLETTDGGQTWIIISQSQSIAPFRSFTDVQFVNDQVGFISGYEVSNINMNFGLEEFVMRTTDGGGHWEEVEIPGTYENRLLHVQFLDEHIGFVHLTQSQVRDALYATTDGGVNWHIVTPPALQDIRAVHWLSEKEGLAYGRDYGYETKLFRTADGGATWGHVVLPLFDGQDDYAIQHFSFTDDHHGFSVGSGGNILLTEDGGKSWRMVNTGYPNFYAVDFLNEDEGYATSGLGFFSTTNGGITWQFAEQSDSIRMLGLNFNSAGRGLFFGFRTPYYEIKHPDQVISKIEMPVIFTSLSEAIVERDSIFAVGRTLSPATNAFLRSGDFGQHWETYLIPDETGGVVSIAKHGLTFFAGTTYALLKSNNGGKTWQVVHDFSPAYLNNVSVIDESKLLVLVNKQVMRTDDGGTTWQEVHTVSDSDDVAGFFKADVNTIFMYGSKTIQSHLHGALWRSLDGGMSWQEEVLPAGVRERLSAMSRAGDHIIVTGGLGLVLKRDEVISGSEEEPEPLVYVYPVLSDGKWYVAGKHPAMIRTLSMVDVLGRQMLIQHEVIHNTISVDIQSLTPGMYLLHLVVHNRRQTFKLVKR